MDGNAVSPAERWGSRWRLPPHRTRSKSRKMAESRYAGIPTIRPLPSAVVNTATMVFLDNNVWNTVADGTGPITRKDLAAARRGRTVEVVSTLELFEEILSTAQGRPEKYRAMRNAWRELVGPRILLSLMERHRGELLAGGRLPVSDRYEPWGVRNQLFNLKGSSPAVGTVTEDIHARKLRNKLEDERVRDEILERIRQLGKRPRDFDRTITAAAIQDVAYQVALVGESRGLPTLPASEVSYARLPSLWLHVAVTFARANRVAGDNRAVKASDNHDRLHVSAGGYFDLFVTDDVELRNTLADVPDLPFAVKSADMFAEWLRS